MPKRKQLRLKDYDYSKEGAYFVTICTYERVCIFGQVINGVMYENSCSRIVREEWNKTGNLRTNIHLDKFIIMPNHIHGLIMIVGAGRWPAHQTIKGHPNGVPLHEHFRHNLIAVIISQFKSMVTKRIHDIPGMNNIVVWQRGYYDHIIRNDVDLNRTREYIINNPATWESDQNNAQEEYEIPLAIEKQVL